MVIDTTITGCWAVILACATLESCIEKSKHCRIAPAVVNTNASATRNDRTEKAAATKAAFAVLVSKRIPLVTRRLSPAQNIRRHKFCAR